MCRTNSWITLFFYSLNLLEEKDRQKNAAYIPGMACRGFNPGLRQSKQYFRRKVYSGFFPEASFL